MYKTLIVSFRGTWDQRAWLAPTALGYKPYLCVNYNYYMESGFDKNMCCVNQGPPGLEGQVGPPGHRGPQVSTV